MAWGAGALLVPALVPNPVLILLPLVVLATGFEVVFAAHVGVERVGRYLQVYFESDTGELPTWEHVAMAVGGSPGSGIDALFAVPFLIAASLNLLVGLIVGGLLTGRAVLAEVVVLSVAHALFVGRVLVARRYAATQRSRDLALFTEARARSARDKK